MTATLTPERVFLDAGIAKIASRLARCQFAYVPGDTATSSGGPFASGLFRRGDIEIGLIVRNRNTFGCPNYTVGSGFAGHDAVMDALGARGRARLVPGPWPTFVASDGSDVFDAFADDLEQFLFPVLTRSEEQFRAALTKAVRDRLERLGFRPAEGHSA